MPLGCRSVAPCTEPAHFSVTVLEETLEADFLASVHTLALSSLIPSVISSFSHFCGSDSHLSLHSQFAP